MAIRSFGHSCGTAEFAGLFALKDAAGIASNPREAWLREPLERERQLDQGRDAGLLSIPASGAPADDKPRLRRNLLAATRAGLIRWGHDGCRADA